MQDMNASLDFDKEISNFRGRARTVTLELWTDGELNGATLSEELTSSNEEYAEGKVDCKSSSERNYSEECRPIGEEYIVCLKEMEQSSLLVSKKETLHAAVGNLNEAERSSIETELIGDKPTED